MKPCKTCKEYSCGANGSDYVSMKCGSEEGFIRVAADCLPNAAELVEFLRKESESRIVKYGSNGCVIVEYGSDGYRLKKAADAIEALLAENARLKAAFDEACAANDDLFQKLTAMKAERDAELGELRDIGVGERARDEN